ncbi:hypothetical protein CNMCM5623_002698 [Aspergillus felis]|uniref:beta-glucosidase n=1 Tax=Aspergillus felis TaxID=1287682 RepID=A0A8H6QBS3_9EURO|nr:hypothetical protein CNMCM5623_002698 [Aspergillus felis]
MKASWSEILLFTAASAICVNGEAYSPPFYPSPWASGQADWAEAHRKAVAFVSKLTLAEKVNLTTGTGCDHFPQILQGLNLAKNYPAGEKIVVLEELGPFQATNNSAFPAGVNVASTWDRRLAYQRGQAMGAEHRDKGVDIQLGPVAGPLGKFPDGGRNWEGFSPDPSLTGALMAETIKGIQDSGVIAVAKHFIGYEQENLRDTISSNIDDKTLHELYLWPFADAVRAGVGSVMCAYNLVNNSYASQNSYLINKLLKDELGFQGFVMSDWSGQHTGSGSSFWGSNLTVSVVNGTVPEWRIDDMAIRIMSAFYKVGRDKAQVPVNFDAWTTDEYSYLHYLVSEGYQQVNSYVDVEGNHKELIRKIGSSSIVLLKNVNNALPLTGSEEFTAIIGEDATANPNGPNSCVDRGCDIGTLAMGWGSGTAEFPYLITPEQAIQNTLTKKGRTTNDYGSAANNYDLSSVESLAAKARGIHHYRWNAGDRKNLTLWQNGDVVIQAAAANCKNTIVVLHTVGPVVVTDWYDHPNITAILWAGLPGQESGNGLVDVLYGAVSPGGKSPFTWGKDRASYGASIITESSEAIAQEDFSEGIFIDYSWFDKQGEDPIYEFGFGLSYSDFSYSDLNIKTLHASPYVPTAGKTMAAPSFGEVGTYSDYSFPSGLVPVWDYIYSWVTSADPERASGDPDYGLPNSAYLPVDANDGSAQPLNPAGGSPGGNEGLYEALFQVSATIANTGTVLADEVPQLYISLGGPDDPRVVLRGFDRLTIAPGKQTTWTTTITRRDISNWDPISQNWVVSNYPKTVHVGSSSRNLFLNATLPAVQ